MSYRWGGSDPLPQSGTSRCYFHAATWTEEPVQTKQKPTFAHCSEPAQSVAFLRCERPFRLHFHAPQCFLVQRGWEHQCPDTVRKLFLTLTWPETGSNRNLTEKNLFSPEIFSHGVIFWTLSFPGVTTGFVYARVTEPSLNYGGSPTALHKSWVWVCVQTKSTELLSFSHP